jgi:hypothetical protein
VVEEVVKSAWAASAKDSDQPAAKFACLAIKMTDEKWTDPATIGDYSELTPEKMRGYSEEYLNRVSVYNGGGQYDTWARAEIARRQSVRLAELITALNQATEKVQTEVTDLTASSTKLEDLTKTLKNLTWVLIVLTFLAAAVPIGIEFWKAQREHQDAQPATPAPAPTSQP